MAKFVFTYTAPGSATSAEIVVKKPSTSVAPYHVWVEATNHSGFADFEETGADYDGAHHEYHHEWTINGQPLAAWSKPQNLIAQHNNPNKRFGKQTAFLFPVAGSYTLDLVITDRLGNSFVGFTETFVVSDPESVFADADRIYVDPTGDWTGLPAASAKYTSLADLAVDMDTFNSATPKWLCLRRGQVHPLVGVNPLSNKNGRDKLYFGDTNNICYVSGYGPGARPVITPGTDVTRDQRNSMFEYIEPKDVEWRVFTGIAFDGGYNPETWLGKGNSSSAIGNVFYRHAGPFGCCLIHDCFIEGANQGTSLSIGEANYNDGFHFMVADCEVAGWRDYGHFGSPSNARVFFAGNYYHQLPETATFGDKNGISNAHGPVRIPRGLFAGFSMNDVFSRGGWDGEDQACLRLFPDSFANQVGYVDRNTLMGGWEIIHMRRSSHGASVPHNVVIERNLTIGTGTTAFHIYTTRSGLTVRDNLMVDLNNLRETVNWGSCAILLTEDESEANIIPGNEADPIVFHGNTYLVLMDGSNDQTNRPFNLFDNVGGYFQNIVNENNIVHKPAGDITHTDFAPIDVATLIGGVAVEYLGVQKMFAPLDFNLTSDVANGDPLPIPYADLTEGLTIGNGGIEPGVTTDQAYWQLHEGTDTDHQIYLTRDEAPDGEHKHLIFAERGHFSVSFDEAQATITNTSGLDWQTGKRIVIQLDRSSRKPAMNTAYAISSGVPLPRPQTGSAAIGAATSGRVSPKDFLLADRGETPSQGALEPA